MKTYYTYYFRSNSGDVYSVRTTRDYKDVYDFMKNEAPEEYNAWKDAWLEEWGEFDESWIRYEFYAKQEMWKKVNGIKVPLELETYKKINGEKVS